jgi:hypothetical protein
MTVLALLVTAIAAHYFTKTKDMDYVPKDQRPFYASEYEDDDLAPETKPTLPIEVVKKVSKTKTQSIKKAVTTKPISVKKPIKK